VSHVKERIKEEVLAALPPAIFFFIAFHIIVLFKALMLRQYGIPVSSIASATVGALLVAKVVLIADLLPIVNRFPDKPLIYNVVWKTVIYVAAALVVHYLEHLIPVWWRVGNFASANRQLWDEIVWPHFWAIQLWLVVLLFLYCALRELVRVLGADQVRQLYFGSPESRCPGRPL
jgi:hypothetical protein